MTSDQFKAFDRLLGEAVMTTAADDYTRVRTGLLGFIDHISRDAVAHATVDARATVSRLNRRAQRAEAALEMKVEQFQQRSKTAIRDYYFAKGMEYQAMVRYLGKRPPPPVSALELKDVRESGDIRRAWEVVDWLIAVMEER
jgi:hypothetical protein